MKPFTMSEEQILELNEWDGVHTEYLINIYKREASNLPFWTDLVTLCESNIELQKAITWLIKHHYDQKNKLPDELISALLKASNQLEQWESKLHVLQLLPLVSLPAAALSDIEMFVRNNLKSTNTFVKAWAYNGLYELVQHKPELKTEVKELFDVAMKTERASIKARVKKVLLKLD
ncbi:hypothetical protein EP331_02690 [bacterium]|nr:MAG: hypothetical protein EP331_02690 [bacterium]